jgi:uncharacterized protein
MEDVQMNTAMKPYGIRSGVAALLLVCAASVSALDSSVPASGLPSASQFSSTMLPERNDVVSWQTLANLGAVERNRRMIPVFSDEILALDNRAEKVQGFMIPLEVGDKQKHFLLAAVPAHCPFCLPAGPEAIVEIQAKSGVSYTFEPLLMVGKFAVLRDDPGGVFYRLTEATQIEASEPSARSSAPSR